MAYRCLLGDSSVLVQAVCVDERDGGAGSHLHATREHLSLQLQCILGAAAYHAGDKCGRECLCTLTMRSQRRGRRGGGGRSCWFGLAYAAAPTALLFPYAVKQRVVRPESSEGAVDIPSRRVRLHDGRCHLLVEDTRVEPRKSGGGGGVVGQQ